MENKEGQRIPEVTFRTRRGPQWIDVSSNEVFAGKTVVVFALPGAFTPTCSSAHVPRYNELAPVFRKHGVDDIVCISVNDGFVMEAWQHDQNAHNLTFLPDGNGEFTRGMGMMVDKNDLGFGPRSCRYSMLVRDGVIEKMFIEPDEPGDPFKVSDADTMLRHIAPQAVMPPDVVFVGREGCSHCARVRAALDERGWAYDEVSSTPRRLRGFSGKETTPQVFVNGKYIGGADEFLAYLAHQPG